MFVCKTCANTALILQFKPGKHIKLRKWKVKAMSSFPTTIALHCIALSIIWPETRERSTHLFCSRQVEKGRVRPLSPTITGRPQSVPQDPNISENFLQQNWKEKTFDKNLLSWRSRPGLGKVTQRWVSFKLLQMMEIVTIWQPHSFQLNSTLWWWAWCCWRIVGWDSIRIVFSSSDHLFCISYRDQFDLVIGRRQCCLTKSTGWPRLWEVTPPLPSLCVNRHFQAPGGQFLHGLFYNYSFKLLWQILFPLGWGATCLQSFTLEHYLVHWTDVLINMF